MSSILLVDDEEAFRTILHKSLEGAGHQVRSVGHGDEASDAYREKASDLVVIDLVMPERETVETIALLRTIQRKVRIVAMSGSGRATPKDYVKLAKKIGANRLLAKPFSPQDFLGTVEQVLTEVP